jgi:hypothetical protein
VMVTVSGLEAGRNVINVKSVMNSVFIFVLFLI